MYRCFTEVLRESAPMRRIMIVVVSAAFLVTVCVVPAGASPEEKTEEPITITADRLETFDGGAVIVFSGSVTVLRGGVTVNSDRLRIDYVPGGNREAASAESGIKKIEADGAVVITSENAVVTGDHAVMDYEKQTVIVTGDRAVLREGENVVEGNKITWFMAEERGVVEDSKRGRVTATIQSGTDAPGESENAEKGDSGE